MAPASVLAADLQRDLAVAADPGLPSGSEAETLLPAQLGPRTKYASAERRLMAAVLEDAYHTYLKYGRYVAGRGAETFLETARWFESADRSWPFSFECICDALDLSPDRVRRSIQSQLGALRARDGVRPPDLRRVLF